MKVLNISGGGTKIVGQFGAAEALYQRGWTADIITGISAGAILSLPIALGKWNDTRKILLNLKHSDFFKKAPFTDEGKLRPSALRVLFGKNGLGDMSRVKDTLRKVVSEDDFDNLMKYSDKAPKIYVGAVDMATGAMRYFYLNAMKYEEALDAILASASIPILTEGVRFKDGYYFDGGVRDFIGSSYVIDRWGPSVTQMINIFSKPLNNKIVNDDPKDLSKPFRIFRILMNTIGIMETEISKSDERIIRDGAELYGFNAVNIYLPTVLKSVYDVNPERIQRLYHEGVKAANDAIATKYDQ